MTPEQTEKLASELITQIKANHHDFWLDPEKHAEQHDFIQILIEERKEKLARAQRIKEKIAGSLILSGILALVGLIGAGALDWLKLHLK